jgi:phenylacetate-CoA ligase
MPFSIEDSLYNSMKSVYTSSPQALKTLIGFAYRAIPDSYRYGKIYTQYLSLLEKSQWWSKDQIENYQWVKTKGLLEHAYKNVPYYRKLLDERAISIKDIQNFHDFKKIPFLTKEIVRKNLSDLLAVNIKKSEMIPVTTGGSTGPPLKLFYEKGVSRSMESAFMLTQWRRGGYRVGDKLIVLRGDIVNNNKEKAPCYFDPIKNRLVLSSYHMIEKNLPFYINKIEKFKPKYLHVYPSSLIILARYMAEKKIKPFPSLKGIFASSETIYDWQLSLFEKVFNCKIIHWYGLNELVGLAGVCEKSSSYHFFPEYSYVELVDPIDDISATEDKKICEIVGTSFANNAMPFIRYRTMDYAVRDDKKCKCSRNYLIVKKVIGRKQDFFIDTTGSLLTFTGYTRPIRPIVDKINAYQYVQETPGIVILKLELREKLNDKETKIIYEKFGKIWPNFSLEIKYVDYIPKTKNGKFRYLIQKLKIS